MQSGGSTLDYNLYLDASRSSVWGDGTGGTTTYQATALIETNTTVTIFGRIFGAQNAAVGTYSDSLVVTISY
jgi:spore coat protein U-like protein